MGGGEKKRYDWGVLMKELYIYISAGCGIRGFRDWRGGSPRRRCDSGLVVNSMGF